MFLRPAQFLVLSCCELVRVWETLHLLEVSMRSDGRNGGVGRTRNQFPVGMRVLAVDDDPVCLKVLETLLRRCQYHGKDLCTLRPLIFCCDLLNRPLFFGEFGVFCFFLYFTEFRRIICFQHRRYKAVITLVITGLD